MKLDPSFWDRMTKDERLVALKGALLEPRKHSDIWDVLRPKRDIRAEKCSETETRIRERWATVEAVRAAEVAAERFEELADRADIQSTVRPTLAFEKGRKR